MRHALRRFSAVIGMVAAAIVGVAPMVARADAPESQGWWTVTNPGGLPVNPASVNGDVPANGLLIQAGPVNPTAPCSCVAMAGLVFELADGTTATDLTLKVAPNSGTTPVATLELCTLVNPTLDAEQGGALADAPDYDCNKHADASLGTGGSTFTFHVGSLVSDGILGVVILPGDSTSRVVLSKPDSSSLATTTAAASTPSFTPSAAPTPTAQSGGTSTSSSSTGNAPALPALPSQPAVGGAGNVQKPVVAAPPTTPASPLAVAPVAATTGTSGSTPVAVIILLAGLGLGAALWALAGRGSTESLSET